MRLMHPHLFQKNAIFSISKILDSVTGSQQPEASSHGFVPFLDNRPYDSIYENQSDRYERKIRKHHKDAAGKMHAHNKKKTDKGLRI
jgi:hypothetical protein